MNDLIAQKIERLKRKGSAKIKRILDCDDLKVKEFVLNLPQSIATYFLKNTILDLFVCEWGRGTGKTAEEAILIEYIARTMPRSKWAIYAPSYNKFFEDEIPNIKAVLEKLGMYENIHYYVGRRAPESAQFDEAFQSPDNYQHCIHFYTGCTFQVLSEAKASAAVGLNLDGLIVTEAVYCNISILERKVFPAIRGSNGRWFEKHNLFGLKAFFSSTPIDISGKWFTDLELTCAMYPATSKYIKAPTSANLENLKEGYLKEAEKITADRVIFEAEYLCIRPKLVNEAFYMLLDEDLHGYENPKLLTNPYNDCRDDNDLNPALPLFIGIDLGAVINSATTAQSYPDELRILKDFFVLSSDQKIQDDLVTDICDYYQHHKTKVIYLYFDAQGNNDTGNTRLTKGQQLANDFRKRGFTVIPMTNRRTNDSHALEHEICLRLMSEENTIFPKFRINKSNAPYLLGSMKNARVKLSGIKKVIQKDKSSEKKLKNAQRMFATDLSDSFKAIVVQLYRRRLKR